ncbi:MAG TPA: metallophosphoesterase, partial [Actinomycetota bacterium]|nr:metallophosphoesterase [Actinomycetota bacterium]
ERQLRTTDGVWTIVMVHQPPFSCSREGDADVRRAWVESLERNGVDLVLSGHEHNYQRLSSATGTTYIVTGGGGDTLYDVDDDCELRDPTLMAADDDDFHFFVVEGSRERIDAQAIGMDASVLDRFTIRSREKEVDRPAAE